MRFFVTQTFENRAYRAFSKARARLTPKFDQLKEVFGALHLEGEQFDDIMVTFVDQSSPYYHEVKNHDRIYQVEVAVPDMSFKPAEDDALLIKIAAQLREVVSRAPVKESTRTELLRQFSMWESSIRQQSIRPV